MKVLRFNRKQLCIPYVVFLVFFVIAPLFVIIFYAFTNGQGQFTFDNFVNFFVSSNTLGTLLYSFALAIVTTLVCLFISYPTAYILARSNLKKKYVLLLLFILPMWINFTLRITALKEILSVIEGNISAYPFLNSVIGMTYDFLPFMILPLYNSLSKLDKSLIEAASDLGANRFTVLDMLYNSTYIMGSLIGSYFSAYDWNNGSLISLILLVIIFFVTLITNRFSDKDSENRGAVI